MRRLRVQEIAVQRGYNLTMLHLRLNTLRPGDPISLGTVRRYWHGTKDGLQDSEPLKNVDLLVLARIAEALGVRPAELINEQALGEMSAAA